MEHGLVQCFFSYKDAGFAALLKWGASSFDIDIDDSCAVRTVLLDAALPTHDPLLRVTGSCMPACMR